MKGICNLFIRPNSGNSIHQWRVLRFRLTVGSGLLTAMTVVAQLVRNPDSPEIIIFAFMFWMQIYYLLHLRPTAAGFVISQKRMKEAGFIRGAVPNRKQMRTTLMIILFFGIPSAGMILVTEVTGPLKENVPPSNHRIERPAAR